jgi:transposase
VSRNPLGHPVELKLTAAEESDIKQAEDLLADHEPEAVIADAGYDSDALAERIAGRGGRPGVPAARASDASPEVLPALLCRHNRQNPHEINLTACRQQLHSTPTNSLHVDGGPTDVPPPL